MIKTKWILFFYITINLDLNEVYTATQSIAEDDKKVDTDEADKSVKNENQEQRPDDHKQEFSSKYLDGLDNSKDLSNIYVCNQCEYHSATKRTLKKHQ